MKFTKSLFIFFIGLAFTAASAYGAELSDKRFLDRVQVKRFGDRVDVVIEFTRTLRYVTHSPVNRGDVIRVKLASLERSVSSDTATDSTTRDERERGGNDALHWQATSDLPLEEISAEAGRGTDNPELIIRFKVPVSFRIKGGTDNRSIIVSLPTAPVGEKTGKPEEESRLLEGTGRFVINLLSQRQPLAAAEFPTHEAFKGHRLYLAKARVKGVVYYRLRLGFFTRAEAQSTLERLKKDFKGAWISGVSNLEQRNAAKGLVDLSTLSVKSADRERPQPSKSVEELDEMMENARRAMVENNYRRAIVIYSRVIEYQAQPYQRDAQEFLGLAYERKGQYAHAKAEYESYLERYPKGEASERVRQRLAGLVTASMRKQERLKEAERREAATWEVYGALSQYYSRDISEDETTSDLEVTRSSLETGFDLTAERRSQEMDVEFRFDGAYDRSFLGDGSGETKISSFYLDLATADSLHSGRIGRQKLYTGGVLGRFDGLYYGYKFDDRGRMNLVSGTVVDSTEKGFDAGRRFYGVNFDWGPENEAWDFNLFFIEQRLTGGYTDRRAVGGEARFSDATRSLYTVVDYDIFFSELNIAYMVANWSMTDATSFNLVLDYRANPLLTLTNAMQGQSVTEVRDLGEIYGRGEIEQLARDRTALSRSGTLRVSHTLTEQWQVSGDVTLTNTSSTRTSGGVDGNPSTGNEYYFSSQLIGSSLLKEGDMAIFELRYNDTASSDTLSLRANGRYPLRRHWKINPRVQFDYKDNHKGANEWVIKPIFKTTYVWKKKVTLELEAGDEWTKTIGGGDSSLYFLYAGYRWDF